MNDHTHDRKCIEMFARFSEYIDHELDPETRMAIERHLDGCGPCLVCTHTLRRTVDICRCLGEKPIPKNFIRRLEERLSAENRLSPNLSK